MITLDAVALPDGLVWSDEFEFRNDTTSIAYSIDGSLLVDRASKQAGRTITLVGGVNFAWITRANVKLLQTALESYPDTGLTLTLHDNRQFQVIPESGTPLTVSQVPVVNSSGLADPVDATKYYIETLKLIEV